MTTEYKNCLYWQLDSLTDKTAMVIKFYDAFGWKTKRRIYKDGNLFSVEFIRPNGKVLTKKDTKDQVMKFMIENNVFDSFIIQKY